MEKHTGELHGFHFLVGLAHQEAQKYREVFDHGFSWWFVLARPDAQKYRECYFRGGSGRGSTGLLVPPACGTAGKA